MAKSDKLPLFRVPNRQTEFHKPYEKGELLDIERKVKDSVSKILERTTIEDPSFEFKDVILSGSMAEGLKVRQLNEFDFLLVLNTKFEVKEDDTLQPGFVNIISEEKLHPFSLRRKFYRALMKALQNLDLTDKVLVTVKIHAVSVKLRIVDDTLSCSNIDVDLVLALQPPLSFWPRCSKTWQETSSHNGLPAEVIEEVIANGVYFVPRYESGKQEPQWRVSFSVAESIIMRRLTEGQRSAFRVMKVILERQKKKSIEDKETGNLIESFVDKMTTTYHIKTILLHLNEDASLSKLEERQYLICILKALLHSLKTMHLTHYFIPDINLYSGLKELPSGKLWSGSREEMYRFTIQQYEDLLENLPEDLSELKNEAVLGKVAIRLNVLTS
ncbi:cyclic GMP-AMP synthase-like [Actinia tenebrosa]|uniref:Cyclic GMP-AMP synthase-like n=1 Tax=Actinia tenebrosa TaxID=6105 RepID=A0A6P8HCC4_ACTTE|nr:cyclic GMP-AMP synthase-like [Actinia tenebrosa]